MKANNTYPIIDPGDDLTQTPTGTSRVEIAHIMLIPATSTFAITPILESGITLRIPVLDESETIKFTLPPWRK